MDWSGLATIAEEIAKSIAVIGITAFGFLVADLLFDKFRNGWRGKKEIPS